MSCIRPIWHQKESRVKSHIQICFLAYVDAGAIDEAVAARDGAAITVGGVGEDQEWRRGVAATGAERQREWRTSSLRARGSPYADTRSSVDRR